MNINIKENCKKISDYFFKNKESNKKSGSSVFRKKQASVLVLVFFAVVLTFIPIHGARAGFWDPLIDVICGGIGLIVYNVMNIALFITVGIVHFGAYLIDIMVDPNLYAAVLSPTSVVITAGWTTIRDFCNMFFIFFLLVVAFATILRISAYSAKAILPKFLIAIFMINFSQEITKLVIDFGQVFMYEFMSWMGGSFSGPSGGGNSLTFIADYFYNNYHFGLKYSLDAVVSITFAVAYTFALGFLYIILAGFLLVRVIAFVVLIIFSPFAVFAMVFPGTRKYTTEWWSSLIKYTMFGPVFMFFVYLSSVMANSLQNDAALKASITGGVGYAQAGFGGILTTLIPNVVSLGMLMAAIPMSQKLGGIAGSSTLVGGGLGGLGNAVIGSYAGAKLAGGWGQKITGGVASRTRLGTGYDKVRDAAEKQIAKAPFVGKSIVMKNMASRQKEKEERMKKLEVEFGDLKNVDIAMLEKKASKTWGVDGTTDDKAFLLKVATAQGKLGDKNADGTYKYAKDFNIAERSLSKKDLDQITNKSLGLATMTNEAKARLEGSHLNSAKATEGMTDENKTKYNGLASDGEKREFMMEQIKREKMQDLVKEGKAHEVQDLDNASTARIWKESQTGDQQKASTSRMSDEQREKLQLGYMANTIGGQLDSSSTTYAADLASEKAKIQSNLAGADPVKVAAAQKALDDDIKFRTQAVNAGKGLTEAFASCTDAAKTIEKEFSKFDVKVITKFTKPELEKYGYLTNASQRTSINRDGKQEQIDTIKLSMESKLATTSKTAYNELLKKQEALKTEKDPAKKAVIESNIKIYEARQDVKDYARLEKGIDHINSLIKGDKY